LRQEGLEKLGFDFIDNLALPLARRRRKDLVRGSQVLCVDHRAQEGIDTDEIEQRRWE
jgi:hypothetical protein